MRVTIDINGDGVALIEWSKEGYVSNRIDTELTFDLADFIRTVIDEIRFREEQRLST